MASTYLSKTFSSTPTGTKKCTISMWIKRSKIGAEHCLISWTNGSGGRDAMRFDGTGDQLRCFINGASSADIQTNRKFRDVSAWYHIVLAIDTTQGTSSNRMKLYINGVQETSFTGGLTYPSQDHVLFFGSANACNVGRDASDTTGVYDGSMSHVHFVDGSALAPTVFGETDSTTGEWKIITTPSYTVGTNGFFILKDGNSVTDSSTNSNNFTVGAGTLTKTEDCPSNIFATWNVLNSNPGSTINFTNGNTHVSPASDSSYIYAGSTLAMPKKTGSKFYAEFLNYGVQGGLIGIGTMDTLDNAMRQNVDISNNSTYTDFGRAVYRESGNGQIYYVTGETNTNVTMSNNDIQQIAIDLENGKFYVGKNGTWTLSGDPANNTGGLDISSASWYTNNDLFCFVAGSYTGVGSGNYRANFGNGYFGTTAVSSAGTNASNIGIFEYDVPTGFTALSTKGLNL